MAIRELLNRGYMQEAAPDGDGENLSENNDLDTSGEAETSLVDQVFKSIHEDEDSDGKTNEESEEDQDDLKAEADDKDEDHQDDDEPKDEDKKPEPKKEAKPEPKEEDPYATPEGFEKLSKKTQERFHKLIETNKEKDSQLDEIKGQTQNFMKMIRDTGATNEQYIGLLDLATVAFHPEKQNPEEAVKALYGWAKTIAAKNGLPLPGYDALEGHDDLREQVADRLITQEHAEELARRRSADKHKETQRQQQQQTVQQTEQMQQRISKGKEDVQKFLLDKKNNDLDFEAKAELLTDAISGLGKTAPPEQWLDLLQRQYNLVSKAVASGNRQKPGNDTPLRPSGSKPGSKTPGNMSEAVANSLGIQV